MIRCLTPASVLMQRSASSEVALQQIGDGTVVWCVGVCVKMMWQAARYSTRYLYELAIWCWASSREVVQQMRRRLWAVVAVTHQWFGTRQDGAYIHVDTAGCSTDQMGRDFHLLRHCDQDHQVALKYHPCAAHANIFPTPDHRSLPKLRLPTSGHARAGRSKMLVQCLLNFSALTSTWGDAKLQSCGVRNEVPRTTVP
jgi:hypothetical protein